MMSKFRSVSTISCKLYVRFHFLKLMIHPLNFLKWNSSGFCLSLTSFDQSLTNWFYLSLHYSSFYRPWLILHIYFMGNWFQCLKVKNRSSSYYFKFPQNYNYFHKNTLTFSWDIKFQIFIILLRRISLFLFIPRPLRGMCYIEPSEHFGVIQLFVTLRSTFHVCMEYAPHLGHFSNCPNFFLAVKQIRHIP